MFKNKREMAALRLMTRLLNIGVAMALTVLMPVAADGQSPCAWDQYYDENVDNCGPCREICDSMAVTRTEEQCKSQCSGYLVSQSCRSDQYFDEQVRSCAPCAELCSQRDTKGTSKECFLKCRKYLETNPPDNSQSQTLDLHEKAPLSQGSSSSSSSPWLPGIVASGLGVLALAAIAGLAYCWYKNQRRHYLPASGNDVKETDNDVNGVAVIPMEPAVPVQVSSEDVGSADIILQRQTASTDDPQPEFGLPECDPVAPSSAAYWHVRRQQSS